LRAAYGRSLSVALRHSFVTIVVLFATIGGNFWLYAHVHRGLFPQEDTGRLVGKLQADQSISYQAMKKKLEEMLRIAGEDPAVEAVVGFTGAGSGSWRPSNTATVFVHLKPLSERNVSVFQVLARLRPKLAHVPGGRLIFYAAQNVRTSGRESAAQFQYSLTGDNAKELFLWTRKLADALTKRGRLKDVNSDMQIAALQSDLVVDRDAASRLGLSMSQIDNTLYDAFGQRQVSTIFSAINQYHVVMEVDPRYTESPEMLRQIYVSTAGGPVNGAAKTNLPGGNVSRIPPRGESLAEAEAGSAALDTARNASINAIAASGKTSASSGAAVSTIKETMVPLAAFSHYERSNAPLSIEHQGPFVTTTISFNLDPHDTIDQGLAEIRATERAIDMPANIHGAPAGSALTFARSNRSMPYLFLSAIIAVYIVLGILYESTIHPITIISTLPSAGVGALLALMMFDIPLTVISAVGILLLIGIVKKNAILMVDFAITAKRTGGASPRDAIYEACLLRFRPILMTTFAAIFGAMPLALSFGEGAEMRRPLGVSIVGGLIISQLLTLYTTPVVYLYLDRFSQWAAAKRRALFTRRRPTAEPAPGE
jgi:multidrug efflux pump